MHHQPSHLPDVLHLDIVVVVIDDIGRRRHRHGVRHAVARHRGIGWHASMAIKRPARQLHQGGQAGAHAQTIRQQSREKEVIVIRLFTAHLFTS
jgi:hypothetical protein